MKMSGVVLLPFLVMWFVIRIFLPDSMYDVAITISMLAWLVWIVVVWAWAKSDAGNFIVFPQSKWKMPDGSCRTFDVKVPPDSWEKVVAFPDGAVGYKVYFADKYMIEDPDLPYPLAFDCAYWLLPAPWDVAFQRRAQGEFFHKGVFVTKPDCEDISLYVVAFEEREGVKFPICLVNDCAYTYEKALKDLNVPQLMRADNPVYMLWRSERVRANKLSQHTVYLEDLNRGAYEDDPKDFHDSAEKTLKQARRRHRSIMDTEQSLMSRILNLKTLVVVLVAIVGTYLFLHFALGAI